MPSEPDRYIKELLDRAGADAQPRSPRWDDLPDQLARIAQVRRRPLRAWTILTGAAAMIAAAVGISLYFAIGPAVLAQPQPIRVIPQDIEITVFNETETEGQPLFMPQAQLDGPRQVRRRGPSQGPAAQVFQPAVQSEGAPWRPRRPLVKSGMVLVKDRRIVMNLQAGDNLVRFTDVAAAIDPTSVRFVSDTDPVGTSVVEQNFEYDLATADALLDRFIDRRIGTIAKDGEQTEGYLCSYDAGSLVLAETPPRNDRPDRKTQTLSRDSLRAVRLPEVPVNLHTKPTLVWKIRTQRPGQHDTTLSYVCGQAKWNADYVVVVTPGGVEQGDRLDLQGWVTIDNRSGATYRDAKIKLIAGDVNRVPDPWAPREETIGIQELSSQSQLGEDLAVCPSEKVPEFAEKAFFEYHLYTLSVPSTVKDQQIKQLKLLKADGIKAVRRFVFDPYFDDSRPLVRLEFKNEEENHMGMPLPKGGVRLMQRDADGDLAIITSTEIDHTPKNEEIKLGIGLAFDVAAERSQADERHPSERREINTFRLRMRNHKDEAISARFVEHLVPDRNWSIAESTEPWTREDVGTVHFDFVLGPNEEKTITYTVDYQW